MCQVLQLHDAEDSLCLPSLAFSALKHEAGDYSLAEEEVKRRIESRDHVSAEYG